jgi:hypothetical protein
MMSWSPTEQRNALSGIVRLLSRRDWRESPYGPELRRIVASALDHDDRVLRYHAAQGIQLLEPEPRAALAILQQRLLTEPEPDIASVLAHRLADLACELANEIDELIDELITVPLWTARLASDDNDTAESLIPLVSLMVRLAVLEEAPKASRITVELFSQPVGRPIAYRSIAMLRGWLALPPGRSTERQRAFAILRAAAQAIDALRKTIHGDNAIDLYRHADAIVTQLHFASGAFGSSDNDRQPTSSQDGFADEAFAVLETLTAFKEPSIVHHMVQTLAHLAPTAPSRAFLVLEQAVASGDPYTYDGLAADATIGLIERYLTEFREVLASDDALLSAVRRVLSAFARVGWPAAISLASRLSDAFR